MKRWVIWWHFKDYSFPLVWRCAFVWISSLHSHQVVPGQIVAPQCVLAPLSTRRGLISASSLLSHDTSGSPGNPNHNKATWSESPTEMKSYRITWFAVDNGRLVSTEMCLASPSSHGALPQWKGESQETFSHVDTWKKTMCLFDKRVVTAKGCFCPLCHRWGEIFNLPDLYSNTVCGLFY